MSAHKCLPAMKVFVPLAAAAGVATSFKIMLASSWIALNLAVERIASNRPLGYFSISVYFTT